MWPPYPSKGTFSLNTAEHSQPDSWAGLPFTYPKNHERIEEVRTSVMSTTEMRVYSPLVRRFMYRDFYYVSERLFILSRGLKTRRKTATALPALFKALKFATLGLQVDAAAYEGELNEDAFDKTRFALYLVSPVAATLFRELQRADLAVAQLYMSEYKKTVTYEQRESLLSPLHLALVAIKQHAFGIVPKTMAEQADELQIT